MDFSLLFPLLILLLFVPIFLNGRRQRRQVQEMQRLQQSLAPGDLVLTTSGLRASVLSVADDETVQLEIAPGVHTTWVRAAIREKVNPVVEEGYQGVVDSGADGQTDAADHSGEQRATGT